MKERNYVILGICFSVLLLIRIVRIVFDQTAKDNLAMITAYALGLVICILLGLRARRA